MHGLLITCVVFVVLVFGLTAGESIESKDLLQKVHTNMVQAYTRINAVEDFDNLSLSDCVFTFPSKGPQQLQLQAKLFDGRLLDLLKGGLLIRTCSSPGWLRDVITLGCYCEIPDVRVVYRVVVTGEATSDTFVFTYEIGTIYLLVELAGKPGEKGTVRSIDVAEIEDKNANALKISGLLVNTKGDDDAFIPEVRKCLNAAVLEKITNNYKEELTVAAQKETMPIS